MRANSISKRRTNTNANTKPTGVVIVVTVILVSVIVLILVRFLATLMAPATLIVCAILVTSSEFHEGLINSCYWKGPSNEGGVLWNVARYVCKGERRIPWLLSRALLITCARDSKPCPRCFSYKHCGGGELARRPVSVTVTAATMLCRL